MQINVAQQLKASIGSVRNHEVRGIVDITGDNTGSTVEGEVQLTRTNRSILVKGELHTRAVITCSRCLNLFSCQLSLNIEDEYFPTTDVVSGASLPVSGESGYFIIDGNHVLDLTEAVRQYALLAIPMKPLCREDCGGLRPGCGHYVNRESYDFSPLHLDHCRSKLVVLVDERKGM
jgi:uncharacterized protein